MEQPHRASVTVERILSPDNLYLAWETVRDRATAEGTPTQGILAFGGDPAGHLTALAKEVSQGLWRPSPLARIEIPKPSGGVRRLAVPPVRDRVLERAVYQLLEPQLDPAFTPWSFGYRPGLGIQDAVDAVIAERDDGAAFALKSDLADCFDSLPRDRLLADLAALVPDRDVLALVRRLICRPIRVGFRVEPSLRGVPQGAPLSPLLCNLYLTRFDEAMLGRGRRTVRYGDDLVIPARTEADAEGAGTEASAVAQDLGLTLSERKTRVVRFDEGFEYLGIRLTSGLRRRVPVPEPPRSKALYVTLPGAQVGLVGGQVKVRRGDETLLAVPLEHVGQLVVYGSVGVSPQLRSHALVTSMDVVFLSRNGHYLGRLDSPSSAPTDLRRRQYLAHECAETRLPLARSIVAGKLGNMRALVLRRSRRLEGAVGRRAAPVIEAWRRRVGEAESVAMLMGIEGAGTKAYYRALAALLPRELGFVGRNRRPPRDPVNAALSLGYTLLSGEAVGAVVAAGFDPHVGFLHGIDRGRTSLALDLIEEFRPLVIDTVVLESFTRGTLTATDFTTSDARGCTMSDAARKRFIAAYEERQLTTFAHVPSGQRTTYRRALFLQARQLAGVVMGLRREYRPVAWR